MELHIVHKLMYTTQEDTELFKNWRYAVTAVFFDVPSNENMLNEQQLENMELFHDFMEKVAKNDPKSEEQKEESHIDL